MNSAAQNLQVFIQSPQLQIPIHALTLTPDLTLRNLKLSLLLLLHPQFHHPTTQTLSDYSFFTLNGKPLLDSATVQDSRISPSSTLTIQFRLPDGGGDGGSTCAESRDCYLNMYAVKKPDKVDPNEQRLSKWLNCALSNEPLKHPVVVDFLGNVFNKVALVEALLGKKLPKAFGHIKGLKDMIAVELAATPGVGLDERGAIGGTRFQCPIAGLEFNGKYKFFALRGCGHVLSAKALKEVKSSGCLVCHKEFSESDKIVINGNEEEVAVLREKMEQEKVKLREKRVKKVKNGDVGVNAEVSIGSESIGLSGTKLGLDVKGVEKVSGKIEGNEKVVNGGLKVKSVNNGPGKDKVKRFKAADMAPANATKEVYASIFTSSRKSDFKETYSCRSLPLGRN